MGNDNPCVLDDDVHHLLKTLRNYNTKSYLNELLTFEVNNQERAFFLRSNINLLIQRFLPTSENTIQTLIDEYNLEQFDDSKDIKRRKKNNILCHHEIEKPMQILKYNLIELTNYLAYAKKVRQLINELTKQVKHLRQKNEHRQIQLFQPFSMNSDEII